MKNVAIPKGWVYCDVNIKRFDNGEKPIHCEECEITNCKNNRRAKMDRELLERLVVAFEGIDVSLSAISKGITYREDSDCPSISESMVKIAEALQK